MAYHRRIIYQIPSSKSVLSVLMSEVQLKNTAGEKTVQQFPFVSDDATVAVSELKSTLTLSDVNLPTNADSLLFDVRIYSYEAGDLKDAPKSALQASFELVDNTDGTTIAAGPTMAVPDTGKSRQQIGIGMAVRAFANRNLTLRPVIENLKNEDLQGAVVHVYGFGDSNVKKPFVSPSSTAIEPALSLRIFPNPFNPTTTIHFSLPTAGIISLRIFDVNGRLVREWSNQERSAGEHTIVWDGNDQHGQFVASGMYFSELVFGTLRQVEKMSLVH